MKWKKSFNLKHNAVLLVFPEIKFGVFFYFKLTFWMLISGRFLFLCWPTFISSVSINVWYPEGYDVRII